MPPEATTTTSGSIFDSIGRSIDDLVEGVKEIPKVAKKAAYYTYYTAKAAAGLTAGLAMGNIDALILPAGMAVGAYLSNKKNKKETTFKQMSNELAIGGILGGILGYMFKGVSALGNIVKSSYGSLASLLTRGAAGFATIPPFLATHEYLNRALIKDYQPQKMEIRKKLKGPMKYIIPPVMANFSVVPEFLGPAYQMPVAAGISTAYGMIKDDKKKEEKAPEAAPSPEPQAEPKPI